jgi:hypothetical protein
MAVGVRTQDLRKIYTSAPPLAAGGFIARADAKGGKQPKAQIAALDGLSLQVRTAPANPPRSEFSLLAFGRPAGRRGLAIMTFGRNRQ